MSAGNRMLPLAVSGLLLTILVAVILAVHWISSRFEADPRPLSPIPPAPVAPLSFDDAGPLEDGGWSIARHFAPPIHDPSALEDLRESVTLRGPLGLAVLQAELKAVRLGSAPAREQLARATDLLTRIGLLQIYLGHDTDAAASFRKALELGRNGTLPRRERSRLNALAGIVALHQGETSAAAREPSSEAVSSPPHETGEAADRFREALQDSPQDLRIRWLLNLAAMRLGQHPDQMPETDRVPLRTASPPIDLGRFDDVAGLSGLNASGPWLGGGCCVDDFNGDGRPDLLITSLDARRGTSLFLNLGDGTFHDASAQAGLDSQIYVANAAHADYDNDGDLDVVLLRGAGEEPMRLSLLRNRGDGWFEDVTPSAGLGEPIASGAAAWGDYDADGLVDLFVCGEYLPAPASAPSRDQRRNFCRLYHNRGDGTFRDAAVVAGVENRRCARGAAWGDFDLDGHLDLFVANADGPPRLYRSRGDGTFRDVTESAGLAKLPPGDGCWFWDADNDGLPDLFLTDGRSRPAEFVAAALGVPLDDASHPRLLRNLGAGGFRDVTGETRLNSPVPVLSANFGDVDGDGDLDLYLSCGWSGVSSLVPGRLLLNEGEQGFADATLASGTGVLRGGHSVALADWNDDGAIDLFVHGGGLVPGHRSNHTLFRNPGSGRHWLKLRLVGTRSNRAGIGATVRLDLDSGGESPRSIFRTVGSGSSTGGNSLVQTIGIGGASRVKKLTVTWPGSSDPQVFQDIAADRELLIKEGAGIPGDVLHRRPRAHATPGASIDLPDGDH